ncbi:MULTISPECIES: nicotinate-nucleotide adenylyltransferase [Bacillus]|uniref:nicotinate-nucleotide adenylyltransferase n=1 Tax=Bacillus TaxID=1386 RepID=UPI0002059781|nr:nicotinate-nucleotide adenylyltransferase [Bacillus amyloliquefaciens]AIW34507.1 nicotinate-nucleotide adenylyltransferase [Bacillus subtilis]AEB24792.1 nicotinic acid mononucleotide adenylyltransferase [Bacillus amyloliquefaciens TA208]AEB64292.1 putative nicotinate-nucleotide adenylyltransferase [Bacillus amyloliquefaciens LL3]AEK89812.1 nicotinic acid mononucleotide [Bacillus amyloliquefaciens XH7]MCM3248820.1 nicotinate-nucleotide adenylyltransferase [Bacillus amyloliquefaciens]
MRKIGIFGGTFDPPHNGHLLMANEVLHQAELDEVWFMPNQIPPHKQNEDFTDSRRRVEMLRLAISSNPGFKLELAEMEREGPSYTYDTVRLLKERHPNDKLFFIIGADMIEYLPKWYKLDELLKLIQFIGVRRPGYHIETPYPLLFADVPEFGVSSTMLRERLKAKKPTQYLMPDEVRQYIEENDLYES